MFIIHSEMSSCRRQCFHEYPNYAKIIGALSSEPSSWKAAHHRYYLTVS